MTNQEILMGFIELLDEALICDPAATETLLGTKVPANERLLAHPTIQVNEHNQVSALGLINGICEKLTGERVCAVVDISNHRIERFGVYKSPKPEGQNENASTGGGPAHGPGDSGN